MNGNTAGERPEKKDGLCGLACRIYGRIAMEKKMDANVRGIQQEREAAVAAVKSCEKPQELGTLLWRVVELYAGEAFFTSKKLPFSYTVKGRELFCDRKEKSITEATVVRAYEKILAAQAAGDPIRGPKRLCMFGAPYIWGILKGTGLAGREEEKALP